MTKSTSHNQALLDAGAILPLKAKTKGDLDELVARAYTHPVLATPMVRLGPAKIDEAADLEMSLLGFEAQSRLSVGKVRKQKLGFPAWALVNDKKHARYALDVVSRMKQAVRKMKSKPGFAKEKLDEIGGELARSVPHFLPSYYEEAARAFIDNTNFSYAQQYFEKARQAEREYGLEVDEDMREESFVSFALAGALSVKSLSNYAEELADRGQAGLDAYLRVCVRRTAAGLAPSPAQLKDIKKLCKAVGADYKKVEQAFVEAMLPSPAFRQAAESFFKKNYKTFEAIIKDKPELGGYLLDMWPSHVGRKEWLEKLEAWGLTEGLINEDSPFQSKGSAAEWFTNASRYLSQHPPFWELFERAISRLEADDKPVFGDANRIKPIELEMCLKHDLDFEWDKEKSRISFESPVYDLPSIAEHKVYRPLLVQGLADLGNWALKRLPAVHLEAFTDMLRQALLPSLDKPSRSLPEAEWILNLTSSLPRIYLNTIDEVSAAVERLDISEALASQLRSGLIEEIELPGYAMGDKPGVFVTPPFLTMYGENKAVVLDRDGTIVKQHSPPKDYTIRCAIYVGDDLLVFYGGWQVEGYYWASDPKTKRSTTGYLYENSGYAHRNDDGSVELKKTITPGCTLSFSDLVSTNSEDGQAYRQLPIRSDEESAERPPSLGAGAVPMSFVLDVEPRDGAPIRQDGSRYLFRIDKDWNVSDACGEVGNGRAAQRRLSGVVWLPHVNTGAFVTGMYGDETLLVHADGYVLASSEDAQHAAKAPYIPPAAYPWARTRDDNTSKKLRQTKARDVAELLKVASSEEARKVRFSSWSQGKPGAAVLAEVDTLFSGANDTLKDAIAGQAHFAGHLQARLQRMRGEAKKDAQNKGGSFFERTICSERLGEILGASAWRHAERYTQSTKGPTLQSELEEMRARFDQKTPEGETEQFEWGHHIFHPSLGHGTYVMYRYALAPKKDDEARELLENYAREMVAQGFESDRYRSAFRAENTRELNKEQHWPQMATVGESRVLVWQLGYNDEARFTFIEYAPDGKFEIIDEADNLYGPSWLTPERIDEVKAHVAEHGSLPVREAAKKLMELTGMTEAEATLWTVGEVDEDGFGYVKKGRAAAKAMFNSDPFVNQPGHMFHSLGAISGVWMAGDWRELWDAEVLAQRLADRWLVEHPKFEPFTAEELSVLGKETDTPSYMPSVGMLGRLLLARDAGLELDIPMLDKDREAYFNKEGYQQEGEGFDLRYNWSGSAVLVALLRPYVRALYQATGESVMVRALPALFAKLRERLSYEHYYVERNLPWDNREEREKQIRAELGTGKPSIYRGQKTKEVSGVDGRVLVTTSRPSVYLTLDRIRAGDPLSFEVPNRLQRSLEFVMGDVGDALIEIAKAVAGKDEFAGDPAVSAPDAVARVAKKLKVSSDAARYYLFLCGHYSPKDALAKTVLRFKKKDLEAAQKELLEKNLVLSGKRASAGRSVFLPGEWVTDKHRTHAEAWKRALYGWSEQTDRYGPNSYVASGAIVPFAPQVLFTNIANMIDAGQGPSFVEV